MSDPGPALRELAHAYGVMTSYEERTGGPVRHATAEALVGVLGALGAPVSRPDDATEALRARRAEGAEALLGPVVVVWARAGARPDVGRAGGATVPFRAGQAGADTEVECSLALEDGDTREWRERPGPTHPGLRVPGPLPHGYHQLTVRAGARAERTTVVCAPERTWEPSSGPSARAAHGSSLRDDAPRGERRLREVARDYGVFLPLYALHTARSWGTGDLTDLGALLRWSGERGARFVGTLPLTATFLGGGRAPVDPGPYVPVSRLFWNELYLDAEAAPGLGTAPEAQRLLSSPGLREEVRRLREGRRVRYADSMALKRRVLEAVARAFAPAAEPLPPPLAEFAAERSEAVAYARFRAAVERLGTRWREWPRSPGGSVPPVAPPDLPADEQDEAAFRYHLYVQWAMALQIGALHGLRGSGNTADDARPLPTLYLDLPLGTHPDGFDVWRFDHAFASGLSGGAPPDPFQEQGQDWGFPPLHPERSREDGHAYLRSCLRHLMRASGMLRLDHVMSLHRLWCIPAGHPPTDGAYVRYPAEELYATLCVESNRWECEVVGEDLGTVPSEVREAMERRGLRRMFVLPFELEVPAPRAELGSPDPARDTGAEPLETPRLAPVHPLSVASLGTHDLPPFAAFATGVDIERRRAAGQVSEEEAGQQQAERARWFRALKQVVGARPEDGPSDVLPLVLRRLARSPAQHLLVNIEDSWGETAPQNAPGTVTDENWTLRAVYPLEAWETVPGLEALLGALVRERRQAPSRRAGRFVNPEPERQRARGKE